MFNFSRYRSQGNDSYLSTSYEVTFKAFFCNHSPINTTLKRVELCGTRLTPAVLFDFRLISTEAALPVGLEYLAESVSKSLYVSQP